MTESPISRRSVLGATPIAAGAGLAGMTGLGVGLGAGLGAGSAFARSTSQTAEMLEDPAVRARVRARVIGSCQEEVSMKFYRLNIYGYMGDGNLVPFFTMNHLSIADWAPAADNMYNSTTYECGYYCKFDTDEPIEVWDNPVTGDKRDVFQFLGGPFSVNVGADGVVTKDADLAPQVLRMEQIGNLLMVPTIASMILPNFVDPAKFPKSYSGPSTYWESQATFAADANDAMNEELSSAPAFCHFQNLASWHPWLGMGTQPGRTYGNARGVKIKSEAEIPANIRKDFEKYTPEIFDRKSWTKPRLDTLEYLATQTPATAE
ncbi:DUF1838 family protein [Parasphingorhabdus sp.]|uniref:DUF1838 family protein n=1 Tax=Parasphingorhabdus sp. TaxID=2709688 RepID=UPI00326471C5